MDTRDIALRLHDILRAAYGVRLPGPGCTAEASIDSVNTVKAGLRASSLISASKSHRACRRG